MAVGLTKDQTITCVYQKAMAQTATTRSWFGTAADTCVPHTENRGCDLRFVQRVTLKTVDDDRVDVRTTGALLRLFCEMFKP